MRKRLYELKKSLPYLPPTLKQEVALQYLDTVKMIEKALTCEGSYAPKLKEDLLGKLESIEDFGFSSHTQELRISWEDVFSSKAEWDWFKEHILQDKNIKYLPDIITRMPSSLILISENPPISLEDTVLKDLLKRRHFGDFEKRKLPNCRTKKTTRRIIKDESKKIDGKLLATAWLISKGLTSKEWRQLLTPYLSEEDFKRCESAIHRKIQIKMPIKFKLLKLFIDSLTATQRETVKRVYLENEDGDSLKTIARELKISIHTLRDRLDGVKKRARSSGIFKNK